MRGSAYAIRFLWLASSACRTEPATQMVVVIDSDIHQTVMDGFATRVIDQEGRERIRRQLRLGDGGTELPADYAIGPLHDDATRHVRVEVQALSGDRVLFETHAITTFREGRTLRLDMFLAARCLTLECAEGERCTEQGCVPEEIDPDDLQPFVPGQEPDGGQEDAGAKGLLQEGDLTHEGAIELPAGIHVGISNLGFEYGGRAIAFNPANDSLFIVGHEWDQFTAELAIPPLGGTASLLQPLTDPLEDRWDGVGAGVAMVGGQLVFEDELYLTLYRNQDGLSGVQQLSHYVRPLDLARSGEVEGPFQIGPLSAAFYAGYFGLIPASWQERLGGPVLTGNCCSSYVSVGSYGPAVFVIDPADIGVAESASPLLYYPSSHPTLGEGDHPGSDLVFNLTSRVTGVVFPEGSRSVLFFGWHGTGSYCYGERTVDEALDGRPVPGEPGVVYCYDPTEVDFDFPGPHAYPYRLYVWAYDAGELGEVHRGEREPWEPVPYAVWELAQPDNDAPRSLGGAAYDPNTRRIYLSILKPRDLPTVHVYSLP